ncbi:hypothetical protein GCM10020219_060400 [Nonomuraea dietziae]
MFLRRLAGLFLLGLAHAVFLFPGDILTTYAVVGLALLVLRGITPKAALMLAVALTAVLALAFVAAAGGRRAGSAGARRHVGRPGTGSRRGHPAARRARHDRQ